MKTFIKEWAWQILTILFFLLFLGKGCTSSKIVKHDNSQNENNTELIKAVDSLKARIVYLENNTATKKEIKDEMERVMLDYLIYENDLDKGKTSISEIKNKIEAND